MMGIIGLHILHQGGLKNSLSFNSFTIYLVQILTIICFCSVDVFALLTGYLYVYRRTRMVSIIKLFATMLFYCIILTVIFRVIIPERVTSWRLYLNYLFPPITGRYWYIVCYTFVFLMIPFLNKLISVLNRKNLKVLIILQLLLLSGATFLGAYDFFRINKGFSPLWLICLYFVGAYIRIYGVQCPIKKYGVFFWVNTVVTLVFWNVLIRLANHFGFFITYRECLVQYNSPFVCINAILLLLFFKSFRVKHGIIRRMMTSLSVSTFGIYILHCHNLILDYYIQDSFGELGNYGVVLCGLAFLAVIIVIMLIGWGSELVRLILFRYVGIDVLLERVGLQVDRLLR